MRALPSLVDEAGGLVLGPIPKGVPVNLIANLKLRPESTDPAVLTAHAKGVAELVLKLQYDLVSAPAGAGDAELIKRFANLKKPMLELSKCPDFVVNRGHYFGTAEFNKQQGLSTDEQSFGIEPELSDDDKRALIAFLKTF